MIPKKCNIFALAGCTNSGKSTLAIEFKNYFGVGNTTIINQDEFYKTENEVDKIYHPNAKTLTEQGFYWSFDEKEAINIDQFKERIETESKKFENVILDGNMITEMEEIMDLCDKVIVLTLDYKTCRSRRLGRTDYVPADTPGYFDNVAWPAYLNHLERAIVRSRTDSKMTFIDVSQSKFEDKKESVIDFQRQILDDHVKLTDKKLDLEEINHLVSDPVCGATSIFIGNTRDNHGGREVVHLSYDAYDMMAYKKLRIICSEIRLEFPDIRKIAIFHRLRTVDVGESSVIIGTSSPHRETAIQATNRCINMLKDEAPIFKYEEYSNGESEGVKGTWKSNIEDCQKK